MKSGIRLENHQEDLVTGDNTPMIYNTRVKSYDIHESKEINTFSRRKGEVSSKFSKDIWRETTVVGNSRKRSEENGWSAMLSDPMIKLSNRLCEIADKSKSPSGSCGLNPMAKSPSPKIQDTLPTLDQNSLRYDTKGSNLHFDKISKAQAFLEYSPELVSKLVKGNYELKNSESLNRPKKQNQTPRSKAITSKQKKSSSQDNKGTTSPSSFKNETSYITELELKMKPKFPSFHGCLQTPKKLIKDAGSDRETDFTLSPPEEAATIREQVKAVIESRRVKYKGQLFFEEDNASYVQRIKKMLENNKEVPGGLKLSFITATAEFRKEGFLKRHMRENSSPENIKTGKQIRKTIRMEEESAQKDKIALAPINTSNRMFEKPRRSASSPPFLNEENCTLLKQQLMRNTAWPSVEDTTSTKLFYNQNSSNGKKTSGSRESKAQRRNYGHTKTPSGVSNKPMSSLFKNHNSSDTKVRKTLDQRQHLATLVSQTPKTASNLLKSKASFQSKITQKWITAAKDALKSKKVKSTRNKTQTGLFGDLITKKKDISARQAPSTELSQLQMVQRLTVDSKLSLFSSHLTQIDRKNQITHNKNKELQNYHLGQFLSASVDLFKQTRARFSDGHEIFNILVEFITECQHVKDYDSECESGSLSQEFSRKWKNLLNVSLKNQRFAMLTLLLLISLASNKQICFAVIDLLSELENLFSGLSSLRLKSKMKRASHSSPRSSPAVKQNQDEDLIFFSEHLLSFNDKLLSKLIES